MPEKRYWPAKPHPVSTKEAMEPAEFDRFARKLLALEWPNPEFPGETMHLPHAVLFVCRSSVHPAVLAHPTSRDLRISAGRIMAKRPKFVNREYRFPVSKLIRPFAEDFVADLRSRPDHCSTPYNCGPAPIVALDRKLARLMDLVGYPGRTWRSFRHQAIRWLFEVGVLLPDVQDMASCGAVVATHYARVTHPSEIEKAMLAGEL
jgi:hypothetical protein